MEQEVEVKAKLKLDTTEAESQMNSFANKASKKTKATTGDKVKIPKDTQKTLSDIFTGGKGMSNIGKLAKSATGGINSLSSSLMGMTSGAGAAALALGAVAAAVAVIIKLLQGTDTMQAISQKLTETFDTLREVMAPFLSVLGDLIITLLQIVKDILPLLQPAIDWIALSLQGLVKLLQLIEPVINLVSKAMQALYDIMKDIIKTITFGLIDLNSVMGSTSATKISGTNSSLDTWETSGETAYDKLDNSATSLEDAAKTVQTTFADAFGSIQKVFSTIKDGIVNAASVAWDWIKNTAGNVWNGIKDIAGNVWSSIKDTATSVWTGLVNGVKSAASAVGSAASNLWEGVKNTAKNVWNGVTGFFSGLKFWDNGGTLGAQVWAMNEKGNPEFIFNSGGYDSVINANALENAMYNALKRAGVSDKSTIELKVGDSSADARQLVRWILPALKLEWRN